MTLRELKLLLGIPLDDTSQDELLEILLAASIDFAVNWTHNPFTKDDEGHVILPAGIKPAIASMIGYFLNSENGGAGNGVESERVGPMQQSFRNPADIWVNGGQYGATAPWFAIMKPYVRFQFIPARRKKHARQNP